MNRMRHLVAGHGGIAHITRLREHGATARELTSAVTAGSLRRIRRGWYTTLAETDPRCLAVRLGGQLTGAAALRLQGAWMWRAPPVDVLLARGSPTPTPPAGVAVHHGREPTTHEACASIPDALAHAIPRVPFEDAVALLDWGWKSGRYDLVDFEILVTRLPRRCERIREWVDQKCDSFPESIVRTRLRLDGHEVTSQVPVGGFGPIDLVVDGVVGIEADGKAFHQNSFEADRAKDVAIVLDGRSTLRLTYGMVRDEWSRIADAVERAVASHRGSRSRRPAARKATLREGALASPWHLPEERPNGAGMRGRAERFRPL